MPVNFNPNRAALPVPGLAAVPRADASLLLPRALAAGLTQEAAAWTC